MKDNRLEQRIQNSLNAELSGLNTTSWQRNQFYENATGGNKVKRKLTYSLVLVIVMLLIAATALAVVLLSPKEVVEQVAVPMAQQNDRDWRIETDFTPDELAAFIRECNENGIDLDENNAIMEAIRNGKGYNEEETIMAVCRVAFGGNFGEWTIAEQHWFQDVMVAIGWADENYIVLPGPDDLTEEDARSRLIDAIRNEYGTQLALDDRAQFATELSYNSVSETNDTAWILVCHPKYENAEAYYTASLDKRGNVIEVHTVDYGRPSTAEEVLTFTLTEEEAVHIAAEAIRQQTGVDVPLEDETKYRSVVWKLTEGQPAWQVNFISETEEWGRCSAAVNDTTQEVIIQGADVYGVTADNILARYRSKYGGYLDWNTDIWADITETVRNLPATTMEGKVVKATTWIPWREGLLTRDQAEEQAFKQTNVRLGDLNCASLIDAQPNPVWKFRIIPWDDSYQDSIVVEIDAVTGEMTDLDMYKSDHQDLEPYYHMITLHRIWARLELEENGPLYLARMAVLKQFADLSFDMPEEDSLPIFKEDFWQPEINGTTVRFRSHWSNLPDYQVTLDENGIPVEILKLDSSGTEELPEDLLPGGDGNG